MRIGTWNLEGRWSTDHARVLADLDCDLWLLTEVRPRVVLEGYDQHLTAALMDDVRHWAGILARLPIERLADPHPTSAAGLVGGGLVCASLLPWPLIEHPELWAATDHPGRMAETLGALRGAFAGARPARAIWGGHWNQPLLGNIVGYSRSAQEGIVAAVEALGLQVPTAGLPARNGRQASIDHIACPQEWDVRECGHVAIADQLSDHDLYWVDAVAPAEIEPGESGPGESASGESGPGVTPRRAGAR